jgi:O-acetyl-ADP-ribose deacetylase (regulator of RNase III)
VGPNYHEFNEDDVEESSDLTSSRTLHHGHALLQSAYHTSLDVASRTQLQTIAFPLLSAGVYRGPCSLETVIRIAVTALVDWCRAHNDITTSLQHISVCAFTARECTILQDECNRLLRS